MGFFITRGSKKKVEHGSEVESETALTIYEGMAYAVGQLHLSPNEFYKLKPNEFELIYIRHQQRKKSEVEFTWYNTQVMAMAASCPGNKDVLKMIKNSPFDSEVHEESISMGEVYEISNLMDKQIEEKKAKKNTKD